jgi:hypothetical protein
VQEATEIIQSSTTFPKLSGAVQTMFAEASRWMVGAVLTFPFGTLIFAWLLARRARLGGPVGRPTSNDES